MDIVLWILLCLFASVGAVQVLGWLICGLGRPKYAGRAYQVIVLAREPGPLEEQMRYEIHLLRWSTSSRPESLILLDTGLSEESKQVCRNLLRGMDSVIVCTPEELAELFEAQGGALAKNGV